MKKFLRIAIAAVLIVLAVLTFVSRTVYHRGLLRVSEVSVSRGFVPLFEDVVGGTLHVMEVLVSEGDEVLAGQTLLIFDTRAYELEVRAAQQQILRLEHAAYNGDIFATDELALAQDRLALLLENEPPSELIAPSTGRIVGIFAEPGQLSRVRIENRGPVLDNVVPRDAIFPVGNGDYIVYVIGTRRGLFGPEDYVTAIRVEILRDNGVQASIRAAEYTGEENRLEGLTLARDIEGWVQSGDTVWVRER